MMNRGGIIIEGPDQFGKSTLCEKLHDKLNLQVIHYKPPKAGTDQFEYYTKFLRNTGPYIFDRNYISELVYGPLFRSVSAINKELQTIIEREFKKQNYFVVHTSTQSSYLLVRI